ncbi:MAG: aquaporin family protein [Actinobacteria bacterium]|nr:aquaporin family protein [Actinomycetota bacterium]
MELEQKGMSAYLAEVIGTFLLVFFITSVVTLYVSTGAQASFGSDFAVVGFVQGLTLFGVICMFGAVSGGHFNPAVTLAAATIRKISVIDAVIYVLAQLIGAVGGAYLTKLLLEDEGRAVHYGAGSVSSLLSGNVAGAAVEGIGVFALVLVILAVVFSEKGAKDWGPLAIGLTFVFMVMVGGPLTGACYNPARWFGAALVSSEWGGVWPYLVGPVVGALVAVGVWRFVIEAGGAAPTRKSPERAAPAAARGGKGAGPAEPKKA